jgi:Tol biopolymer transport system component
VLICASYVASSGRQSDSAGSDDQTAVAVQPVAFGRFGGAGIDASNTINAAFSPDGSTVYFSKSLPGWSGLTIFTSRRKQGQWSPPEVASFSGVYRDTDPAVEPSGRFVIFASVRPPVGREPAIYGLFRAWLVGADAGKVSPLSESVNAPGTSNLYPSIARNGTLYFIRVEGKVGRIYRSPERDGIYQAAEPIHLPGDADNVSDIDPTISPDERFIAFSSSRPDSLGATDLYIAFHHDDVWCAPLHFDSPINSPGPELATGLSPDGRTLYFASSRSSVVQPRKQRADDAVFQAEMAAYQNGTLKTYRVEIGAWLDAHSNYANTCAVDQKSK